MRAVQKEKTGSLQYHTEAGSDEDSTSLGWASCHRGSQHHKRIHQDFKHGCGTPGSPNTKRHILTSFAIEVTKVH